ncbi:restriction endonuclease subunit S domain-containing protein [Sansalvadorimonas verongulae]|uniref:restriction endonuclease subunit S n=1 Tax=Sansalvadorimonas verongulae TaxID=2172824 RepID=UPI0012BD092D|nr:restriction endonuclease subunit S [Sansalvadorimonas verongulae]MTI13154.1 restriction endonuclease subunit S [Sansalvadorimonas verongulae]
MEKQLQELCSAIITGATNSTYETVNEDEATHHVLLGSAINYQGGVIASELKPVVLHLPKKPIIRFQVEEGDVVILARGNAIRSAYITKEIAERNVIVSANFILLRPRSSDLLGEAIVAYFNTPAGKSLLEGMSRGGVINNISASSLKKFSFPHSSLFQQERAIELFRASRDVYQSALQLAEQEKRTAEACIFQLLNGETLPC